MTRLKLIKNQTFGFGVLLFQGSPEKFTRLMGNKGVTVFLEPGDSAAVWDFEDDKGRKNWAVFFRNSATLGEVAHECYHIVCGALQERGIPRSDDTEEAYAYTLCWLVDEVLKSIKAK